jgi:hypothetical protein
MHGFVQYPQYSGEPVPDQRCLWGERYLRGDVVVNDFDDNPIQLQNSSRVMKNACSAISALIVVGPAGQDGILSWLPARQADSGSSRAARCRETAPLRRGYQQNGRFGTSAAAAIISFFEGSISAGIAVSATRSRPASERRHPRRARALPPPFFRQQLRKRCREFLA